MKPSKFTVVLLGLNVGLVAAVVFLLQFYLRTPAPVAPMVEFSSAPRPATNAPRPSAPTVVLLEKTNDFRWTQLESEDYRTYIQRLRAVGCPEQTIRDLIIADIDKLMAPRLSAAQPLRKDLQYWEPEEMERLNNFDHRESLRVQREVDFQKREIIRELMGADLVGERMKALGVEDYYGRRLNFLSEEKRGQARTLVEKLNDQEQAIREKVWEEGEPLTAGDIAKLRQLRQQHRAELERLLTPAELEQFELWLSPAAGTVRNAVYGMDASQQEFLALYQLQKKFDDAWPETPAAGDAAARNKWEQERAALQSQMRVQLGEERYAALQRGQDADFRELNSVATRYQLPAGVPATIYEIKQAVLQQRAQVLADGNLSDEQKAAALRAVAEETDRTVRQTLGEKAYKYFLRRGVGGWINN